VNAIALEACTPESSGSTSKAGPAGSSGREPGSGATPGIGISAFYRVIAIIEFPYWRSWDAISI
jgi:hypothetical protein